MKPNVLVWLSISFLFEILSFCLYFLLFFRIENMEANTVYSVSGAHLKQLLIHMSNVVMYIMMCVQPASLISVTTELYTLKPVSVTLTFMQGDKEMWNQRLFHTFPFEVLNKLGWNVICCLDLLLWWMLYSFCLIRLLFRWHHLTQITFISSTTMKVVSRHLKVSLCSNISELISFKLGVMIDTSELTFW